MCQFPGGPSLTLDLVQVALVDAVIALLNDITSSHGQFTLSEDTCVSISIPVFVESLWVAHHQRGARPRSGRQSAAEPAMGLSSSTMYLEMTTLPVFSERLTIQV